MKKTLAWVALIGLAGATTVTARPLHVEAPDALDAPALHLELEKSSPDDDELLSASPETITLWFTQAPQMSGTSVRVLPRGGEPLDLGDAEASEEDHTVVVLRVSEPLADGEYEVHWRAMAQDGHVVRGDFAFTIRATR